MFACEHLTQREVYMSVVIAVVNGKGGVGKSTITSNLAGWLYNIKQKETLIVDLDFQSSSLDWASIARTYGKDVCDVVSLAGEKTEKHLIVKNTQMQIQRFRSKYEFIIIDCRGTIDEFTIGALRSADIVITPLSASALDLQATSTLLDMFEQINATKDYTMHLYLLLNNVIANTNTLKDSIRLIRERIAENNSLSLCKTIIHRREEYKTAWGEGESIFATNGKGKDEFLSFIKETSIL